jgi:hypothetical protein
MSQQLQFEIQIISSLKMVVKSFLAQIIVGKKSSRVFVGFWLWLSRKYFQD